VEITSQNREAFEGTQLFSAFFRISLCDRNLQEFDLFKSFRLAQIFQSKPIENICKRAEFSKVSKDLELYRLFCQSFEEKLSSKMAPACNII